MSFPLPPALAQQMRAASQVNDLQTVAELFGQAVRTQPWNFQLRIQHAGALGQSGRYAACRQAFKALLEEVPGPRKAEFRGVIGTLWRDVGRHDLAEPHLRALVGEPHAPVGAHEAWIDVLEHLNRVEDAFVAVEKALRRFPDHPTLVFLAARLQGRRGAPDTAEALLRRCLTLPGTTPALGVEIRYALGHALDAQGRYGEAFAAFCDAKKGPLAAAAQELRQWRVRTDHLRDPDNLPTAEDFKRFTQPPPGWKPARQAFLVGCPRSGTTLLERVLDAHPDIVAAPETVAWRSAAWLPLLRERHAAGAGGPVPSEGEILAAVTADQITDAFRKYRLAMDDNLDAAVGGRLLVDKNPSYFSLLGPISRLCPGAKLLVALRDPRAIAWSCFTQPFPVNAESVAFLDLGTTVEHTATWLARWRSLRDRLAAPWCEVRYENVVRDLPGEARRVLDFLGVAWNEAVLAFHRNPAPVRSPSYASASQPLHAGAVDKWRHYEPFMAPHLAQLAPLIRELGYVS